MCKKRTASTASARTPSSAGLYPNECFVAVSAGMRAVFAVLGRAARVEGHQECDRGRSLDDRVQVRARGADTMVVDVGQALTDALRQQEQRDFWRLVRETSERDDVADGLDVDAFVVDEDADRALERELTLIGRGDDLDLASASWLGGWSSGV